MIDLPTLHCILKWCNGKTLTLKVLCHGIPLFDFAESLIQYH